MVYMLTKSAHYFYDWAAIEEPSSYPGLVRKAGKAFRDLKANDPNAARKRPGVDREIVVRETRRARSVWSISPSPYTESHFATMPPDLAERCIMAGSRKGGVVLDPFAGAGTTGLVADRLGRDAVLIDLFGDYTDLGRNRITKDAGLFAEVTHG
jgi:DNA modification methylase